MSKEADRAVREALDAIDGAKTKVVAAGLMLAAAGLKDHKAVLHLRGVMGGLGCARDCLRMEQLASPAAARASTPPAA